MANLILKLTSSRSSRERFYLLKDGMGMGGHGLPPDHYKNNYVVVNGVNRGNGYQGYMAVDYALSDEVTLLPDSAKRIVRDFLKLGI